MTRRTSIRDAANDRRRFDRPIRTYRGPGSMSLDIWSDWLNLRREYVANQQWGDDLDPDRYDDDPATVHILHTDPSDRVLAGVRATPVRDIRRSLSWSMVSDEMRNQANRLLASEPHRVWDITRLVHREGVPVTRLVDILVHSAKVTIGPQIGTSASWLCAMTPPIVHLCRRRDVTITNLAMGLVKPTDTEQTILCLVDAHDLYHRHVASGNRVSDRQVPGSTDHAESV